MRCPAAIRLVRQDRATVHSVMCSPAAPGRFDVEDRRLALTIPSTEVIEIV
jgi:hypothetical protein